MIPCRVLRILSFIVLLAIGQFSSAASGPITITSDTTISSHFEYWEDVGADATLADVRSLPASAWQFQAGGQATRGITGSAYWLRVPVVNRTSENLSLIAELGYSQLDDVSFHVISDGALIRSFQTGDTRPFYPRDVDHPNNLLRFQLAPEQENILFIRVATEGTMVLPLSIWRENHFYESAGAEHKLQFFYFGSLTVIILLNLAVFLTLREKLYLYYCLAIFGYLIFLPRSVASVFSTSTRAFRGSCAGAVVVHSVPGDVFTLVLSGISSGAVAQPPAKSRACRHADFRDSLFYCHSVS